MSAARSADAVLAGMLALLPPGALWPRRADSNLGRLLRVPAEAIAGFEADAEALLPEADIRQAAALLADYERVLGLDGSTMPAADRRAVAHARWIAGGGQSRAYFIALAAALGTAITIAEMQASQCGLSVCGDVLAEAAEVFRWVVSLPADRLIDAECGASECGDALGDIALNICEVAIRAAAPAHTTVVFSYV